MPTPHTYCSNLLALKIQSQRIIYFLLRSWQCALYTHMRSFLHSDLYGALHKDSVSLVGCLLASNTPLPDFSSLYFPRPGPPLSSYHPTLVHERVCISPSLDGNGLLNDKPQVWFSFFFSLLHKLPRSLLPKYHILPSSFIPRSLLLNPLFPQIIST